MAWGRISFQPANRAFRLPPPGGRYDTDGRPTVFDRVRQLCSVHRAGQVNVRKDNLNVRAALQDGNGVVGIGGLDDFKAGVPDRVRARGADQTLVLDYQDHRELGH
jgi:hypothetical protein